MNSWTGAVVISVIAVIAVVVQYWLGSEFPSFERFNNSVIGRALTTVFVSGLLLPYARLALAPAWRARKVNALLKYLDEQSKGGLALDTEIHRKQFVDLFGNRTVEPEYLRSLDEKESAVFLLGLQFYYSSIVIDDSVGLFDLTPVAEKAARDRIYRKVLVTLSLDSVLFRGVDNGARADSLLKNAAGNIYVRYKSEDEDIKLFERVAKASGERVFIFSTTSQMSNESLAQLREYASNIAELNLFIVSPFIESDGALGELSKEYDVPDCALPKGQFLPNRPMDLLRRVIRVLVAIEAMLEFRQHTGINVRLWLFRQKYPDIKLRILSERGYMQFLPGPLKYANNIYRFGIELTDKEVIDPFVAAIRRMMGDSTQIMQVVLDKVRVSELQSRAIREAYWFFVRSGQTIESLESLRPQFRFIIKSPRTDYYLDAIKSLVQAADRFVEGYDFSVGYRRSLHINEPHRSDEKDPQQKIVTHKTADVRRHVSVGVLLIRNGHVFMIKKVASPYEGQHSIIAGHVEEGETPLQAMRREFQEEIGVEMNVEQCKFIRHYDDIVGDVCRYGAHHHEWYVFVSDQVLRDDEIKLSQAEIGDFSWVKLEELMRVERVTFAAHRILSDLGLR